MTDPTPDTDDLLTLENLGICFKEKQSIWGRQQHTWILDRVNLCVKAGDAFCLIGESGSGKTTLAMALAGFQAFGRGRINFKGTSITAANTPAHKRMIRQLQMVFQDPVMALNPHLPLQKSIQEPLAARKMKKELRQQRLAPLIDACGLSGQTLSRRPGQVSGGQNQRACIVRALSTRPELLILDEPLTALDAVTKNRIIGVLKRIKQQFPMTFFIITHDMDLVRAMANRVGVIYLGRILETASAQELFSQPGHPYTRALLSTAFTPGIWNGSPILLKGEIPLARDLASSQGEALFQGCIFHTRCPQVMPVCCKKSPDTVQLSPTHSVCCHRVSPERAKERTP